MNPSKIRLRRIVNRGGSRAKPDKPRLCQGYSFETRRCNRRVSRFLYRKREVPVFDFSEAPLSGASLKQGLRQSKAFVARGAAAAKPRTSASTFVMAVPTTTALAPAANAALRWRGWATPPSQIANG